MHTMRAEALTPHPLNSQIYADEADEGLVERIDKLGIINPLLVTADGLVISGHRRLDAARKLQLDEVPVIITPVSDPLDIEELVIDANKHRRQSNEQMVREYQHLKELEVRRVEARREAARQLQRAREAMAAGPTDEERASVEALYLDEPVPWAPPGEDEVALADDGLPVEISVPPLPSRTEIREAAAKEVGRGPATLEKGARVVAEIDALTENEELEQADALRKTLNNRSVNAAWRRIVGEDEEKARQRRAKPPTAKMRSTIGEMERWLDDNAESPTAEAVRDSLTAAIEALQVALAAVEAATQPSEESASE